MAFWVVGGGTLTPAYERDEYHVPTVKRRVSLSDDADARHVDWSKRQRLDDWSGAMRHHQQPYPPYPGQHPHDRDDRDYRYHPEARISDHQGLRFPPGYQYGVDAGADSHRYSSASYPVKNLAFNIVPNHPMPMPDQAPPLYAGCAMERTESGLSIASDTTVGVTEEDEERLVRGLISDMQAARLVQRHLASYRPNSQPERILKSLINPKSPKVDFPLDNDALINIFSAANELFFANRLSNRVAWDWSHQSSSQYAQHIVGTTALRHATYMGGYETLIVLSSPILKDTKYNRRLLISTFLHEMIHSFLFVTCGVKARNCGGHTEGFRHIANTIDKWAGPEYLRLGEMEADLENFRDSDDGAPHHHHHHHQRDSLPYQYVNPAERLYPAPVISPSPSPSPSSWCQGQTRRSPYDRADYPGVPPVQLHSSYGSSSGEWQWHDRESFRHRGPNGAAHHQNYVC